MRMADATGETDPSPMRDAPFFLAASCRQHGKSDFLTCSKLVDFLHRADSKQNMNFY